MLTREQIQALRKPFRPEAIKSKVQVNPKNEKDENGKKVGWGTMVFFLDSRDVAERLDLATEGNWGDEYSLFGDSLECTLTVCGVTRRDVGEGKQPKDLYSDAFKRAAVKFGVGAFLYRLPSVLCKMEKNKIGQWEPTSKALGSLQKMKELAQGGEAWPKKFDDVFLKSDFQASEDFSEPEKEEEPVPVEQVVGTLVPVIVNKPLDVPFAGRSSYDRETDTYTDQKPESPEHVPPPAPPVKGAEAPPASEFQEEVQRAKKALNIPAEQTPVKFSDGDGPITGPQRKKLMATLNGYEVKKKEDVIGCLSFLLRRPLESSNEISSGEASSLIDSLSLADVEAWRSTVEVEEAEE